MRESRGAFFLVVVLMLQAIVPLMPADAAEGRSTPDFLVTQLEFSVGGSIEVGGEITIASGMHVLRVEVTNQGPVPDSATLNILHKASSVSAETSVTSISLGVIAATSTSGVLLVNWTANLGDSQTIIARVSGSNDINTGNDESSLNFDVEAYHLGTWLADTVPGPSPGFSDVRLDHSTHTFNASVRNDGVKTIQAYFEINLTEDANPSNSHSFNSGTIIMPAGSIYSPSVGTELSASFDAALILGSWTLSTRVHFTGASWSSTQITSVEAVTFSDYIIELSPPSDRAIEPGSMTTMTFLIHNLGITDALDIELGSDLGWHDTTLDGSSVTVEAGVSSGVSVTVNVPSDATKPSIENVYLNLTSAAGSYTARAVGHVNLGDQYKATINPPAGPVTVTPAQTESLLFRVNNSGNVPAAFNLEAGLSSTASNWVVICSTPVTEVLQVGDEVVITVQVTPAPLSSPINPSEKNAAGDSLSVWLQATPTNGGIPSIGSVQTLIRSIIAVDPSPESDFIVITEEDLVSKNGSGGIDEILSLSVQVRHNLGSAVTGGVAANITVGTIVFTPTVSSNGLNEAARWGANVTPSNVSSLEIGEVFQSWLLVDGPSDEMPMAGTIIVPVTATPKLTPAQESSGILASPVTRNITFVIPSVVNGSIIANASLNADVGNLTNFTIKLANTGNEVSSYRLSIVDDLPDLWTATLETSDLSTSGVVSNLSPSMSDYPDVTTNEHITNLTLKVITDPQAPADTFQAINIRIEDAVSGELLTIDPVMIRVEESVNFELHPTNESVDLSPYETPLTRVYVNNTGNVVSVYSLWIDRSLENDVQFLIEGPSEIIVAPGESESIKIRLRPDSEASHDTTHMATLWVLASNGLNLSASIHANISADHHLFIDTPNSIEVTPGQNETVAVTISNTGNLQEELNLSAVVDVGWETSFASDVITLPINGSIANTLTIVIPSLGGNQSLAQGEVYELTVTLYQLGDGSFVSSRVVQLIIAPVFNLEMKGWPEVKNYHSGWTGDWNLTLTNIGNRDVIANLEWDVFKSGLEIASNDWEVVNAPTSIILPQNKPVSLKFSVDMMEATPDLYLSADLRLTVTPDDDELSGSTIYETDLQVSRLFPYKEYNLDPRERVDDSNLTEEIMWSHIPKGVDGEVAYLIELCGAERLVDLSLFGDAIDPVDYTWAFALDNGGTIEHLSLSHSCDGDSHFVITLPPRRGWTQSDPLKIIIDTPNGDNILSNDGYNLTFRLYHPDEHNSFTEYTEATFNFHFETKSLPVISSLEIIDSDGDKVDTLEEGEDTKIRAIVKNQGTSIAIQVAVNLSCEGIKVEDSAQEIPILVSGQEVQLDWDVRTEYLDWWGQSTEVNCVATLSALNWNGEKITNDPSELSSKVESWSPGIGVAFISTLVLLAASIALLRLVKQNEKFRLAAIYSGLIGLGFAFHLGQMVEQIWWGPLVMGIAALWVWYMTWKSTDEFQLIHEDYQRARKGISTLYSDHVEVLTNSKRQLSIILAMPILGMIAIILGLPPQMNPNSANMMSLLFYIAIVIAGTWLLVWQANKMYGALYGRLTDVEVKSNRIERDLGDPARLLTELASEGIDLTSIISTPTPNVAADGEATPEEVHQWDEEINALLGEESGQETTDISDDSALQMDSLEEILQSSTEEVAEDV